MELVVAVRDGGAWRDVATVNTDFAMNPWLASYWGLRRFPVLLPDGDGVLLLWVE